MAIRRGFDIAFLVGDYCIRAQILRSHFSDIRAFGHVYFRVLELVALTREILFN